MKTPSFLTWIQLLNSYGNTVQTMATYEDYDLLCQGDQDLDALIEKIKALDIDWNLYDLVKRKLFNYPALQKSISSMFQVADYLFIPAASSLLSLLLTLLLVLWLNARLESGNLAGSGALKVRVGQFVAGWS